MKIKIRDLRQWDDKQVTSSPHAFILSINGNSQLKFQYDFVASLNQMEDLETDLTDIIKQLQDYRMKHSHD